MERLTGGIAMHRPVNAPTVVLALGNDSDFWAIKAAREWPVGPTSCGFILFDRDRSSQKSRITAHSLLGMQKDKAEMDALLKLLNLSDRVTYIRGDPAYACRF